MEITHVLNLAEEVECPFDQPPIPTQSSPSSHSSSSPSTSPASPRRPPVFPASLPTDSALTQTASTSTPYPSDQPHLVRPTASTPNLHQAHLDGLLHPHTPLDRSHFPATQDRPALTYLNLPWKHSQEDLVPHGFGSALSFVDEALLTGGRVLAQWAFSHSLINEYPLIHSLAASVVSRDRLVWRWPLS